MKKRREEAKGHPFKVSNWASGDIFSKNRLMEKMWDLVWTPLGLSCEVAGVVYM